MKSMVRSLLLVAALGVTPVMAEESATPAAATIDSIKQSSETGGCFYIHSIDTRRVIDDRHVLVYAPGRNKPWLLELSNACPLLRNDDPILFEGTNGKICAQAGDALRSRNQSCGIAKLYLITPDDAKALKDLAQ